ncbi:hypothetical protein AGOR_G00141720 [Albula goreensis]|uniref:Uncharacterized protein n=1 Tax=Albula goreensis TaxID=1534307 RepID=A0A8T3D8Z5_9TELE|nr:hypothetical protein AGOR_G00141720 [Albula goreensis]
MKKALQLDEAPPTQSPAAVEEGPGGGVPNGLQLCRKEESLAPSTHCETRVEQSQDCGNHRREASSHETPLGPDCKPYHSKILQLLSTPRKRSCSSVERPRPLSGPPASWSTLSGLRVMGSFKKLRSSVLQGIQSRGIPPANQEAGKFTTANQEAGISTTASQETGCTTGANQEAGHSTEASQHKRRGPEGV